MQIVRTETETGGAKRTRREEIIPVFAQSDKVEPDQAADASESMSWTLSMAPQGLWPIMIEAMRQFISAAQSLDSELEAEQAGGDDSHGGIYTAFFNHELIKVGHGDDDGDLNLTNMDKKIAAMQASYGVPAGATSVMGAIKYLDSHYLGEFEKDEETGLVVPVSQRPKRARVLWTDGAMRDFKLFGNRLEESHEDLWPQEEWFAAIMGEGEAHDETLDLYQDIAKKHSNVHVYSFDQVSNPAEIAEDMAIAVLAKKAA
jgi:hypothetical protein